MSVDVPTSSTRMGKRLRESPPDAIFDDPHAPSSKLLCTLQSTSQRIQGLLYYSPLGLLLPVVSSVIAPVAATCYSVMYVETTS
mmetsp:Transcript_19652/g.45723  ORF Transcript_19652/g.45723 Transcript_19652/m.45723 type:complete len:84 (-) Transcript_19652:1861-2112(-)